MLDQEGVALLGKLKLLAKKSGSNVDLIKMSSDIVYAEMTLRELSNSDDPELVMVVITLMNRFGMLKAQENMAQSEEGINDRYIGALR